MKGFTNSNISSSSENSIPISEKGVAGGVATLDLNGKISSEQLPDMDFGLFGDDITPIMLHNISSDAHSFMILDGNINTTAPGTGELDTHNADPSAHQNIIIDGNMIES